MGGVTSFARDSGAVCFNEMSLSPMAEILNVL